MALKVLGVIPARAGSKRVPRKNLKPLGDKKLVEHIMVSALNAKLIDKVILSTDDEEIAELGKKWGGADMVPYMRPQELAQDQSPLIEVVNHAYGFFKAKGEAYDAVMSIQPSAPFLRSTSLDKMVALWKELKCDSVATVALIDRGHPYISKRLDPAGRLENFVVIPDGAVLGPSQKREKAYYLTGGCYLRTKELLEAGNFKFHVLGRDSRGVVVDATEAVDINEEMDFKFAEFLAEQKPWEESQ